MRCLLKWKMKNGKRVANARVLYLGFKHRDVLEKAVDKNASTLSRAGRSFVMAICALCGWEMFTQM